jgi:ubiquinone/menaquinone biosynthesis C-methylase UbiE
MDRLGGTPELLDGPLDDVSTLRGNLRDLARINRWLGGVALSRRAVDRLLDGGGARHQLLDVGTGGADIPAALLVATGGGPRALEVTALDSRPEVLEAALANRPDLGSLPGLAFATSDGRSLPFGDRSFDVVHASLLVHHLDMDEAIAFLREARRVARLGVVVNDLVRARHHWLLAHALVRLGTRNRYTRHDGPLSVRRAYTRGELRALLAAAGLRPLAEIAGVLGHRVAIAAVPVETAPVGTVPLEAMPLETVSAATMPGSPSVATVPPLDRRRAG